MNKTEREIVDRLAARAGAVFVPKEQQRMSKDEVPEWAFKRVNELCEVDMDKTFISVVAFARYIAAHEPAPVDPLREIVEAANDAAFYKLHREHVKAEPRWLEAFVEELRARLTNAGTMKEGE